MSFLVNERKNSLQLTMYFKERERAILECLFGEKSQGHVAFLL